MWNWKQELSLALYTALAQITGSSYFWNKSRGLSKLKIHMERERKKQLQPYRGFKTFNAFIRNRDKNICYLCLKYIAYGHTNIEHDIPLVRGGYTTEANCHSSHDYCNKEKGTKTAQEYLATKR